MLAPLETQPNGRISDTWQSADNIENTSPISRFFVHMDFRIPKQSAQAHSFAEADGVLKLTHAVMRRQITMPQGASGWWLFRGKLNRQTRVCDSHARSVPGSFDQVFHHR